MNAALNGSIPAASALGLSGSLASGMHPIPIECFGNRLDDVGSGANPPRHHVRFKSSKIQRCFNSAEIAIRERLPAISQPAGINVRIGLCVRVAVHKGNEMAKVAGQKLKVFQAQFGFFETIIAASSQAAALRAWGTHQNLFATGEAKLCADEGAVAAALQHPETSLRRPVGSNEPFALQPTSLPKVPEAKKPRPKSAANKQQVSSPEPDRSQLNVADKALHDLDEGRKKEEAEFHREAEALEAKRSAAQEAYVSRRKRAAAAVSAARDAYRKAGGTV